MKRGSVGWREAEASEWADGKASGTPGGADTRPRVLLLLFLLPHTTLF